jgi:diacylglycerol kinase family enzyme
VADAEAHAAVRVGLVHNEDAGDARSLDELHRLIRRQGHVIAAIGHPSDGVAHWDDHDLDLVVAAGGDGTIAAGLCALAESALDVPLAILPMGTANNIATSLDVPADVEAAVDAWSAMQARPFDVGTATGPWGERCFVESVGGGLVTHGMVVMDRRHYTSPTPSAQLTRARAAFADVLEHLAPVRWDLTIDGRRVAAELLLLEALNIAHVGPNLRLADASPLDGWLTLAGVEVAQRRPCLEWLRGERDEPPRPRLWQAREVVLHASDRLHVDDVVLDPAADAPVRLRLDIGRVHVWLGV